MASPFKILERLLGKRAVQLGIQRKIIDRAARMLDPQQQVFSSAASDIDAMFHLEPVALYVHFPFCASACTYCIFKKTLKTGLIDRYVEAVLAEIDLVAGKRGLAGRRISSLHLGGGTPSLVPAEKIENILHRIQERLGFASNAQITLEGNPESLLATNVLGYQAAGVHRISIGVQSLDDNLLSKMGRTHTGLIALNGIRQLQDVGVNNLSVDLIYGFDGQTKEGFKSDLRAMIELRVPHISAFPLISRSVRDMQLSERRARDERRREMYSALVETLESAGYSQYSTEDFTLGPEARSKYQIDAWRFPKRDVVALGAGSLGSLNGHFYSNLPDLDVYFASIAAERIPIARVRRISTEEECRRGVLLGAKYIHISRRAFVEKYGVNFEDALEPLLTRLSQLGLWTVDEQGIHVTKDGLQVISEIWSELILANLADAASQPARCISAA